MTQKSTTITGNALSRLHCRCGLQRNIYLHVAIQYTLTDCVCVCLKSRGWTDKELLKDQTGGKKLRFSPTCTCDYTVKMRGDRIGCKKYLRARTWAVDQEPGDPWLILPLFPTLASSKGDTVILNTITKAEPGQRCNHTGPERRNEDVNSWLLHLHFHPSPPFSILSVFRQREGCVCRTGRVTGPTCHRQVLAACLRCSAEANVAFYASVC